MKSYARTEKEGTLFLADTMLGHTLTKYSDQEWAKNQTKMLLTIHLDAKEGKTVEKMIVQLV